MGIRDESSSFFAPAADPGAGLPADRVYPQGRRFPFAFFSVHGDEDYDRVYALGLTLGGPVYGNRDEQEFPRAAARGMGYLYSIGLPRDEVRSGALTEEAIREGIAAQVRAVAHREEIAWWYLKPEELRHWRRPEIRYLEIASNTIRETDPLRRPVWMYDPGHRHAGGLSHTARHLDIVGKGMYTNYSGMQDQRVWCRWTIEQQIGAIVDANPGAIPIAVPEMFRTPDEEHLPGIPAWVRHDVYCALVAGARGVVVFSFARRRGFAGAREAYLEAYLEIVEELCGERDLGQVFLFGERRDDLRVRVVSGPETVSMLFPSGGVRERLEYPSISWADLAHGGHRYFVAVNSSPEPVTAEVAGFPAKGINVEDLFARRTVTPSNGTMRVEFGAWGARAFRFSPQD